MEPIKRTFWGAFLATGIALFFPFIDELSAVEVAWEILKMLEFKDRFFSLKKGFIMGLLVCVFCWWPIIGTAFYQYTIRLRRYDTKQRLVNSFIFLVGSAVYILPIYAYIDGEEVSELFGWGYWMMLAFMTLMFACYLKVQQERLIKDDALWEHLIDNDNEI